MLTRFDGVIREPKAFNASHATDLERRPRMSGTLFAERFDNAPLDVAWTASHARYTPKVTHTGL